MPLFLTPSTVLTRWVMPLALAFVLILSSSTSMGETPSSKPCPLLHQTSTTIGKKVSSRHVIVTGASRKDPRVVEVINVINGLLHAAEHRDIDAFMKYYANNYISGDNLNRAELRQLILDTWKEYSDMTYESTLLEIRVNGNWITVESEDTSMAKNIEAPFEMFASGVPVYLQFFDAKKNDGLLTTRARNLMYLRKIGDEWRIDSDQSLYEDAVLRYGKTTGLNAEISVPDKVFAGQSYTAAVSASFPTDSVAVTSVNRSEMVYPQASFASVMRLMSPAENRLERVFTANTHNRNEMVSTSLGLLEGKRVVNAKGEPAVNLTLVGVLTFVKRVNVAAKAPDVTLDQLKGVVSRSANGKIDLEKDSQKPIKKEQKPNE
ncbi:MAG: nuclear transport factor 2 family protein [Vampirovibrio sp.]